MSSIDNFIQQLILSGLADSFLSIIEKHYLKVVEVYNIVEDIEEDVVKNMECDIDEESDTLSITINLTKEIEVQEGYNTDELNVQIINNVDSITINVSNNYRNEDDIYESRFARHKKTNSDKWS